MTACSVGDATWAKKWRVTVAEDVATVTAGTPVRLKRIAPGTYEDTVRFGNSGSFSITFADLGQGPSLRVENKALGCIWHGAAS